MTIDRLEGRHSADSRVIGLPTSQALTEAVGLRGVVVPPLCNCGIE